LGDGAAQKLKVLAGANDAQPLEDQAFASFQQRRRILGLQATILPVRRTPFKMKKWRITQRETQEPIWPFVIASLSGAPVQIPLPARNETTDEKMTVSISSDSSLKKWARRILLRWPHRT
jgi:hypothetical protein